MNPQPKFAALLQSFFTDRLVAQRNASQHTIASYRDTFRLLLEFSQRHLHQSPSLLAIEKLDATFIGRFLNHLEIDRSNTPRSRNIRLAAIHSFFKYVALEEPSLGALAQRVLAIPCKRYKRRSIDFLARPEIDALLAAPDQGTYLGRRDRALLLVAAQTGLRASELIGLRCQDVVLGSGAHVHCVGKGRNAALRCVRMGPPFCVFGCAKEMVSPPTCCFPVREVSRSAMMGSITSCPNTSPRHE